MRFITVDFIKKGFLSGTITTHLLFKTTLLSVFSILLSLVSPLAMSETFVLQKQSTAFAIDGNNGSRQNGLQVYLWDTDLTNVNQQWIELNRGDGFYAYQKTSTSLCLDGGDGGARGQAVILLQCDEGNQNQHWRKVSTGNNDYRLEKRNAPRFSIDGNNGSQREQGIYLWFSNSDNVNQQWTFFPVIEGSDDIVGTDTEAANFLLQSTFGPTEDSIEALRELGYSQWFRNQIAYPIDGYLDKTLAQELIGGSNRNSERYSLNTWFEKAVTGDDQLRQVATYALSQIFATSTLTNLTIRKSTMHAVFKDILQNNAFGNYRDVLQEVTYSTQMGNWLTYVGNRKADPETGSLPDENYAREIMQLFTIGVVQLNQDGTAVIRNGEEVELYAGDDIRGLAKVFTGLYWPGTSFDGRISVQSNHNTDLPPMVMHDEYHSEGTKTFLGTTIPEFSDGDNSISAALDVLFNHDNMPPFVSKILIQRLVTSNPSASYVERVANAFTNGTYQLPDGSSVGSGQRGDLVPVWAAILFAPEARGDYRFENTVAANQFGKLRDPIERFVHWMRVSDVRGFDMEIIARFGDVNILPFRSPSVFNFYRSGYVASNTSTGDAGLMAPELQIFNGPNIIGFLNTMRSFISRSSESSEYFFPAYTAEIVLADNAQALVDHLNLVYTANQMTEQTQQDMIEAIESISITANDARARRVHVATMLTFAAVEFNVRR